MQIIFMIFFLRPSTFVTHEKKKRTMVSYYGIIISSTSHMAYRVYLSQSTTQSVSLPQPTTPMSRDSLEAP